ncbi:expressed protein [Phakopsora pachyrhizi]|uniref:Expressed protein n=1 Tax=Phakopsora pachyrhizi TaxID=170000 RepID=A0AAV0BGW7_PHAPC|nr:expressed protein [Phakopsora pachyrhizi]
MANYSSLISLLLLVLILIIDPSNSQVFQQQSPSASGGVGGGGGIITIPSNSLTQAYQSNSPNQLSQPLNQQQTNDPNQPILLLPQSQNNLASFTNQVLQQQPNSVASNYQYPTTTGINPQSLQSSILLPIQSNQQQPYQPEISSNQPIIPIDPVSTFQTNLQQLPISSGIQQQTNSQFSLPNPSNQQQQQQQQSQASQLYPTTNTQLSGYPNQLSSGINLTQTQPSNPQSQLTQQSPTTSSSQPQPPKQQQQQQQQQAMNRTLLTGGTNGNGKSQSAGMTNNSLGGGVNSTNSSPAAVSQISESINNNSSAIISNTTGSNGNSGRRDGGNTGHFRDLEVEELVLQLNLTSNVQLTANQTARREAFLNSLSTEQRQILDYKMRYLNLNPNQRQLERDFLGSLSSPRTIVSNRVAFESIKRTLTPDRQASFDPKIGIKSIQNLNQQQINDYDESLRKYLDSPDLSLESQYMMIGKERLLKKDFTGNSSSSSNNILESKSNTVKRISVESKIYNKICISTTLICAMFCLM